MPIQNHQKTISNYMICMNQFKHTLFPLLELVVLLDLECPWCEVPCLASAFSTTVDKAVFPDISPTVYQPK